MSVGETDFPLYQQPLNFSYSLIQPPHACIHTYALLVSHPRAWVHVRPSLKQSVLFFPRNALERSVQN